MRSLLKLSGAFAFAIPAVFATVCNDAYNHDLAERIEQQTDAIVKERSDELTKKLAECPPATKQACAEAIFAEALDPDSPSNEAVLKRLFKKSCLFTGKGNAALALNARSGYYQNAGIALGSALAGYYSTPSADGSPKPLPFTLVIQGQIGTLISAEMVCRNRANGNESNPELAKKMYWKSMGNYAKFIGVNNAIYYGMKIGEDWARGEEVLSFEAMKKYLAQASMSMVSDIGFAHFHVIKLDEFFVNKLPEGRKALEALLKSGALKMKYFKDAKLFTLYAPKGLAYTGEVLTRLGYGAARNALFQLLLNAGENLTRSDTNPEL